MEPKNDRRSSDPDPNRRRSSLASQERQKMGLTLVFHMSSVVDVHSKSLLCLVLDIYA